MLFFNGLKNIDVRALGASLYYARLSDYLKSKKGPSLRSAYEELSGLSSLEKKIKTLCDSDIVLCNIGPYAWIYFYLREKYNKKFKIIRDVQTAFWIGYFLQEFLVSPLIRKGDIVLFPSAYNMRLYRHFFPESIGSGNSVICYPLSETWEHNDRSNARRQDRAIRLGWVGRISEEKNFDAVIKVLSLLSKEVPCKLYLCGPVQPEYRLKFKELTGSLPKDIAKNIIHVGRGKLQNKKEVDEFFKGIDLLLFPSVASMESLGQVIVQASCHDIPVIAADHAAADELLSQEYLAKVKYNAGSYDFYQLYSLGKPDVRRMARLCLKFSGKEGEFKFDRYDYSYKKLVDIISRDSPGYDSRRSLNADFMIRNTEVSLQGFKLKKEDALNKAMRYLKTNAVSDIARSCVGVARHLDFRPIFKIKNGLE